MTVSSPRRQWLAPEVIQTSAMDCGPAALKCLLDGFGVPTSYGRLREACQTDVDGSSITVIEEVAVQLGLDAEQIILSAEEVLLPEAQTFPALVTVILPSGLTHFVVAWSRWGQWIQLMDPATGRRWLSTQQFLNELYVHKHPVTAEAWREWAGSDDFGRLLHSRLTQLGADEPSQQRWLTSAIADPSWRSIAALEATTRMVALLVRGGGLTSGTQATAALELFFEQARQENGLTYQAVPEAYWSVIPAPPAEDGAEQLFLRGAVLVRVKGRRAPTAQSTDSPATLPPELAAALTERPVQPTLALLHFLLKDGLLTPLVWLVAIVVAAFGATAEAVLFRGLIDMGQALALPQQRLGAAIVLVIFLLANLLGQVPMVAIFYGLGRRLEMRLRLAFLQKIPNLGDRYFQSRLVSDMAERSHSLQALRQVPELAGFILKLALTILFTSAGLMWLDPAGWPIIALTGGFALGWPLIVQFYLSEPDLRVRTHLGASQRFYLDAMLGLVVARAHGAEQAVRREHESLLVEWARASANFYRSVTWLTGVQLFISFALAAGLIVSYLTRYGPAGGILLMAYWAINLSLVSQELAELTRQYPTLRNIMLRMLEPLGAPEDESATASSPTTASQPTTGVAINLDRVTVRASGHVILHDIQLAVEAGTHVAIVGPSGAGKSSLVGLLLGWHRAAAGHITVDGAPLNIEQLRRTTAWVDPAIQLWNRSLIDNLTYGAEALTRQPLSQVLEQADLIKVLEQLPDGLQTVLGEGGALVSGGEGQRVRLGRALLRPGVRLVILDEPFRGLDRDKRRLLLARARELWRGVTLLCITHDVGETQNFERVVVIENGQTTEMGLPAELAAQPTSRYHAMLAAEHDVRENLWSGSQWRHWHLQAGQLSERAP